MAKSSEEQALFNDDYNRRQLEIIQFMHKTAVTSEMQPEEATYTVKEIASGSRLSDPEEVLRTLYIMEGQRMVSPYPEGDFTASHWNLTSYGIDIAEKINSGAVDVSEIFY